MWDESTQTPWYRYRDAVWWEGYGDNPRSLKLKYELVKAQALKGVLIVRRAPQRPPRFACPGVPRALCPS